MSTERFPVGAGHILQFARAVGDTDPVREEGAGRGRTRSRGVTVRVEVGACRRAVVGDDLRRNPGPTPAVPDRPA